MEKITIALIVAVVAIIIGLILTFSGVGWYVSNNNNNKSQTGPLILLGFGIFILVIAIIALGIYLLWPVSSGISSSNMMNENLIMRSPVNDKSTNSFTALNENPPTVSETVNNQYRKSYRLQVPSNNGSRMSPVLGEALENSGKPQIKLGKPSPIYMNK